MKINIIWHRQRPKCIMTRRRLQIKLLLKFTRGCQKISLENQICVQQDNNYWDIKWAHKLFGIYSRGTKH